MQRACAFNVGAAYVEAGKPQKGLDFLKRAEPGERGERVADFQFNLGAAREALLEPAQAAGHYLQAAQLYRSQGEGGSEGDACMKLAHCHILTQVSLHGYGAHVSGTSMAHSLLLMGYLIKVEAEVDFWESVHF